MSRLMLDTGPIIWHIRRKKRAVQLLRNLGYESRLAISAVTRVEVHAGMLPAERFATQKFLARFITYNVDREIADRAGDILGILRRQGLIIDLPDAIIAATAMANHLALVTFNIAHFNRIPGLSLYLLPDDFA